MSDHGVQATQAGHGVQATQAGDGVQATQAGDGVQATQAGHGVQATQAGDGVQATQAGHATDATVEVVPGVPAGLAAAAALGAPLGHDHVTISLSDLHTPWTAIEARLRASAEADLVVVLYNPRSQRRTWQLDAARTILLERRAPDTPVGVVTDAGRRGESVILTTLAGLDVSRVGMTTCVVIGSSTTTVVGGRMVTPRGLPS
ncbi:MAG: SAM-dependent methyltransferase [Acidimicrobiales bacterium]